MHAAAQVAREALAAAQVVAAQGLAARVAAARAVVARVVEEAQEVAGHQVVVVPVEAAGAEHKAHRALAPHMLVRQLWAGFGCLLGLRQAQQFCTRSEFWPRRFADFAHNLHQQSTCLCQIVQFWARCVPW